MGGFANTFRTPTGVQTDVSGASSPYGGAFGMGGAPDMAWLMDLAKRRAQQKLAAGALQNQGADLQNQGATLALKQQRAAMAAAGRQPQFQSPMQLGPGQQLQQARALIPEQTAAQRAMTMTGGMTGEAYNDMNRQFMLQNLMQGKGATSDYHGFTDLVNALSGSSAAAVDSAGRNSAMQADINSPINQASAQWSQARRMYPGMATRMMGG